MPVARRVPLPRGRFRLRPWPGAETWFYVWVAPTHAELQAGIVRMFGVNDGLSYIALVQSCSSTRFDGLLGFVLFSQETLGAGVVAHEMVHAAFRALERERLRVRHWRGTRTSVEEELHARAVEHLTAGFWRAAYRRGLA